MVQTGVAKRDLVKSQLIKPELVKPRVLKRGDTIGICAPASFSLEPGYMEYGLRFLKKLGLKYKLSKNISRAWGSYAGTDQERLDDLHSMFADPEVSAIMCARGGNGTVRLLPGLDFDLIGKNPKILIGFSDITGLLIPIHQQTGLVTFHGPTFGWFFKNKYSYDHFVHALMQTKPIGLVEDPKAKDEWDPPYPPPRMVLNPGSARGPLIGGCLTLISQLMGTPYQIDAAGKILFIEDIKEEPHAIDRMLTQLQLAGTFNKVRGVIIGECLDCNPGASKRNQLTLNYGLEHVLREKLSFLKVPVVYGLRFGHGDHKITLPLGVTATLDATQDDVLFRIEESATI
jgi:muramoyltetrapeptide carboxypeptidase